MMHHEQTGDAFKTGYADRVMKRECRSPWRNLMYATKSNALYIKGYMQADDELAKTSSFKFAINGQEFWIDKFESGYMWSSDDDQGKFGYLTIAEAQQDAIDHVQGQIDAETEALEQAIDNRKYGTHEEQVYQQYRDGIL